MQRERLPENESSSCCNLNRTCNRPLLNKAQSLSDLRQQLLRIPAAEYDVAGEFEYKPLVGDRSKNCRRKPSRIGPGSAPAVLGVTAANSQYALAKAKREAGSHHPRPLLACQRPSAATWSFSVRSRFSTGTRATLAQTGLHPASGGTAERGQRAGADGWRDAYEWAAGKPRNSSAIESSYLDGGAKGAAISANTPTGAAPWPCSIPGRRTDYRATQLA